MTRWTDDVASSHRGMRFVALGLVLAPVVAGAIVTVLLCVEP